MVNVVEEMYQCWNKNWIVFYVKFVLSTKNYGHACHIGLLSEFLKSKEENR